MDDEEIGLSMEMMEMAERSSRKSRRSEKKVRESISKSKKKSERSKSQKSEKKSSKKAQPMMKVGMGLPGIKIDNIVKAGMFAKDNVEKFGRADVKISESRKEKLMEENKVLQLQNKMKRGLHKYEMEIFGAQSEFHEDS